MSDSQGPKRKRALLLELFLVLVVVVLVVSVLLPMLQPARELRMITSVGRPGAPSAGAYGLAGDQTGPDKTGEAALPEPPAGLKLIYTAEMRVAIEKDLAEAFPAKLAERVKDCGGYVSESLSWRQAGEKPAGRITIRVPSDKLNELMDWIGSGATVLYRKLAVQDITDQYVDMEVRLANLQAIEVRLKDLLNKAAGKLDEVLKVELEMQRVRGEIEQLQGRKRLWDHQVAFSTLTVSYEVGGVYRGGRVPTESFAARARAALAASLDVFRVAMGVAALGAIYAWPWLVLLLVVLVIVWLARRVVCRKTPG